MKKLSYFVGLFLMAVFLSKIAGAATYYVAPGGNDAASGSITEPWETPQKAATMAAAGDVVYLRAGTYRITGKVNAMVNFARSGTSASSITLAGYPGETAILNGMLDRSNPSYWTLYGGLVYYTDNLRGSGFDGQIPVVVQDDVVLEPKDSLTALDAAGQTYFDSSTGRLYVRALGGGNPGNYHLEISQTDCLVQFDTEDQYIILDNLTLTGAYYGIRCVPNGAHRTFRKLVLKHFKNDAIKFNTSGNNNDLIEHCRFSSYGDFGIDSYGSSHQTFRYNEFTAVHYWKPGGAIKTLADSNNHLIEGNYIHDLGGLGWEGALELREAKYLRVINNLIVNVQGGGINIYGDNSTLATPVPDPTAIGVTIVNNTCYHTKMSAIYLMQDCQDTSIKNNVVVQLSGDSTCLRVNPGTETGFASNHNDFIRTGGPPIRWLGTEYTLAQYQSAAHQDLASLSSDPLFANAAGGDFHLQSGSPALDRGDPSGAPALDLDQAPRPQGAGIDLGAYERVSEPVNPTTIQLKVSSRYDDSFEKTYNGSNVYYLDGSYVGAGRINGFRFQNVPIPRSALITEAHLLLYCYYYERRPISIRYAGEASADAPSFTRTSFDISDRPQTSAQVLDTPSAWVKYRYNASPYLSAIIQEIVDQPEWQEGNALALFIHDENSSYVRSITCYEGNPTHSASLIITYYPP
jgi:hypothetical protein